MTVQELYNWAVKHNALDLNIAFPTDGGDSISDNSAEIKNLDRYNWDNRTTVQIPVVYLESE